MARILVAEDETLIRLVLAEELTDRGHDVLEAGSAAEAIEIAAHLPGLDLLLTDVQMPGEFSGIQLADILRQRHPDLPVIYVTGRPDSLASLGGSGSHDAVMRKPYSARDVAATVKRLLGD